MAKNVTNQEENEESKKEITIKTAKGLVGEAFKAKDGKEYCEVKIPNKDGDDKTPWASFVVRKANIHEDKFGKGMWFKLPQEGTTTISRSVLTGKDENGKNIFENQKERVTNTELKGMVEFYKEKSKEKEQAVVPETAVADKATKSFKDRIKEAKTEMEKTGKASPKKVKEKANKLER